MHKTDEPFFLGIINKFRIFQGYQELKPVGGVRKYEAVVQALEKERLELDRSVTIGDSITDWSMLKKTREAGGLAISFNGNEYAVSNCNVAVMSENCMVTALMADVFERDGLEAVEALISDWGWSGIRAANRQGAVDESIYIRLSDRLFPVLFFHMQYG